MIKAILFDLNGTMVDDMAYHTKAWFDILNNDLGANLSHPQVLKEMYGKNEEVLTRIFGKEKFTTEEMNSISLEKEKKYQQAFLPALKLIKGLHEFLNQMKLKQVKMAIASAAIPFNINFVLDNLHIRDLFDAIVSADDVSASKPHPETFLKAAHLLGVDPAHCIVLEDAPKGVEAAENALMKTVVLTTMHEKEAFAQYKNIVAYVNDYNDPFFKKAFNY